MNRITKIRHNPLLQILTPFIILCMVSCSDNEIGETSVVNVKFDKNSRISDSILINTIYLPLETTDECLIGRVNKLRIIDGCIYIMDSRYNLGIYKFDMNGKFLFKISNIGKGPGEFTEVNDFFVNDEEIMILSFRKILYYSNENGDFKYETTFDFMPDNFSINKDNMFFFFQNREVGPGQLQDYHIVSTDSKFQIQNEYLQVNRKEMLDGNRLCNYNGEVYLSTPPFLDNTLYKLTADSALPVLRFDFGKDNAPDNYIGDRSIDVIEPTPYPSIVKILPSKGFGIFRYLYNNRIYIGFYGEETSKSISGGAITIPGIGIFDFDQVIDNLSISHMDASEFIDRASMMESYRPEDLKHHYVNNESFRKAIEHITEFSNPVLIFNTIDTALLSKLLQ